MTDRGTEPVPDPAASRTAGRTGLIAAVAAAAVVAVGAFALWALFLRSAAPPAVGLASSSPVASVAPSPAPGASADPAGVASPAASGARDGIAGTWTVDPSIGSFSDFTGSFVGYRIEEELAGVGAKTAVGRTPDVTGSMTIDGTAVTEARIEAHLSTLQSDDDRRDGQLRRQGLETGSYPTATFVLGEPIALGALPAEGQVVTTSARGQLTLHGQTRDVEIPLEAKLENDVIAVTGSLPIALADYGMTPPRAMIVLSIADRGTMELQLHFTRS